MIIPRSAARIDHPDLRARNVRVRGVGHMSLPIDGGVVHEIGLTLDHLDEAGVTVTEGVTPLPRGEEAAAIRKARGTATSRRDHATPPPPRGDQAIPYRTRA